MSNLFSTGLSGLAVARAALQTTAHNTANVYTEGYSRQTAQVVSSGGILRPGIGFFGSGAQVTTIARSYDQYLVSQLVQAQAGSAALSTYHAQIGRIDNLLADPEAGLAPLLQGFFAGVQGVANAAADPAARQQLVSAAQTLAGKFRSVDQYLNELHASVDSQVEGTVGQINNFAREIAGLNKQISMMRANAGGLPPNDLLDQRDQLVSALSKLVGTRVVVQDGGQYNVFIGNGQTLVLGDTARQMQVGPSHADPSRQMVSLTMASGAAVELRDADLAGGSLGGLLQFRSETLVQAQNSLGRMAIALADSFNRQHQLGVDLHGAAGQAFFTQSTPAVIANDRNQGNLQLQAAFASTSDLTASDYVISVQDVAGVLQYTATRLSDGQVFPPAAGFPMTLDGVTLSVSGGTAQAGDSFLLQPTRTGARDLAVRVTDPTQVAAAVPILVEPAPGNRGGAGISAGAVDPSYLHGTPAAPVTLQYAGGQLTGFPAGAAVSVTLPDGSPAAGSPYAPGAAVTHVPGATVSFEGMSFVLSGAPAEGDSFTVSRNGAGVSDGRNALLLRALQGAKTMDGGTASFAQAYAQLVSSVGNRSNQLGIASEAQASVTAQIRAAQQSVSGVNQDEETANLLMFQQMYQGNAKVIQTAAAIFDAILAIDR
ncbi:flagellar hook-associated protein FlgK [Ramlibacter tataouinensis]|uniref:flagellar hook-associated protein FlgK n=1 Tax=Ramlibacter tataouinensis TaxID=94132 RepID=UPI0022F3C205|nr:flagellar hook-associated protein FlgK [Ramlibacter tataouinensis]WBY00604.1 flagellar hook-associated protein FlgK [Ramlibacter tataouinensis]